MIARTGVIEVRIDGEGREFRTHQVARSSLVRKEPAGTSVKTLLGNTKRMHVQHEQRFVWRHHVAFQVAAAANANEIYFPLYHARGEFRERVFTSDRVNIFLKYRIERRKIRIVNNWWRTSRS